MKSKKPPLIPPQSQPLLSDDDCLFKPKYVAKQLSCSETQVYRLARTGGISAFYFRGMVRIPRSSLLAFMKANTK